MDGILWYISLVHIANWITDQAISVDLPAVTMERHPGHAIPGGEGMTPRDVRAAMIKVA